MKITRQRLFKYILIGFFLLVVLIVLFVSREIVVRWQQRALREEMTSQNMFSTDAQFYERLKKRAPMNEVWNPTLWLEPDKRYKPNYRLEMEIDGERLVIQTNEFGFRSPTIAVPKPIGIIQIACLGSSTTVEGWTNETTYPAILQRTLRQRRATERIEVVNCGVSGMRSKTELQRLSDVLALEPDMLIEYGAVNDIVDMMQRKRPLVEEVSLGSRPQPPMTEKELDDFEVDLGKYLLGNMRRIYEQCRVLDVTCVFCTFCRPTIESIGQEEQQFFERNLQFWYWKCPDYRIEDYCGLVDRYNVLLAQYCNKEQIMLIDVAKKLRRGRELFVDICHMTPKGIEKKANIIAVELERHPAL